jgi:hypothetical protein
MAARSTRVSAPSSYANPNSLALARKYSCTSRRNMRRTVAFLVRGDVLGRTLAEDDFSGGKHMGEQARETQDNKTVHRTHP